MACVYLQLGASVSELGCPSPLLMKDKTVSFQTQNNGLLWSGRWFGGIYHQALLSHLVWTIPTHINFPLETNISAVYQPSAMDFAWIPHEAARSDPKWHQKQLG